MRRKWKRKFLSVGISLTVRSIVCKCRWNF